MNSLYDELSEKLRKEPSLTKRGGPRADIGLLLFSERDALRELWKTADRHLLLQGPETLEDLRNALETLRPLFGERIGALSRFGDDSKRVERRRRQRRRLR